MPRLSHQDRIELLRFIGEKSTAQLSDREILNRAVSSGPTDEKDFEQHGTKPETHHRLFDLPPVSPETLKLLYNTLAEKMPDNTVGAVRIQYSQKPPEKTKEEDKVWKNSDFYEADETDGADDAIDDALDSYEEMGDVYGYQVVFITRIYE